MKRTIFVVLTVVALVALMAGTAFAVRYDSGYTAPAAGNNPHGTYDTTTAKCAVCHAVHNPGNIGALSGANKAIEANRDASLGNSQALLRDNIANACSYCHVSNTFVIKTVYAETPSNYTVANTTAHNTNGGALSDTGVSCTDCHQVHGAVSSMVTTANGGATDLYMQSKILKGGLAYDADSPAFAFNNSATANQANLTRWCSGCHTYYEAGYNNNSHVMTSSIASYANASASSPPRGGQVAWLASTNCRSCHMDGVTDAAAATNGANNYPHYIAGGFRFLRQANASNVASASATSANDGTCLICHRGDDGFGTTIGAGLNF